MAPEQLSPEVLRLDAKEETARITATIRTLLRNELKRRGIVVALSGGIDSSVTAALAVRAVGKERVFGLEMPELHSAKETTELSGAVISHLGIESRRLDIAPILEAEGFYREYDSAVRSVIPEYGAGWKSKIVISSSFENEGFSLHTLVAQAPDGTMQRVRLPLKPYLEIVAATNLKQRTRKMLEYYHADRLNYAVAGTPNRLEYDQGFFVKLGDGAADLKPIAHLYKSQVYQLAEHLGIPEEIRRRPPTTDTYSMPQGQDEFYFSLPYRQMDLCLYAKNHGIEPEELAPAIGLSAEQAQKVLEDIDTKRATTRYLHLRPLLIEKVPEIAY
ncbi:NAD(+) synthase [Geomonas sp. RF6]|uniref:NAD(+) synthase n=1 Tax=Geomonas sp. RF6 TaxID=2897342 RepID=UPI001E48BCD1|nr:NAD(+) synthase [Geomonas sp. RF6]UFS69146.1 NAD(+) synthase [Geomonas sp. RF6]